MMQQIKPRQRVHTHTYVQRSSQVDKRALCCRPAAAAFATKSQIVEWSSFSCGSISIEPMFQVQTLRLVTGRLLPRSLPLAATDCYCHIRLPRRHYRLAHSFKRQCMRCGASSRMLHVTHVWQCRCWDSITAQWFSVECCLFIELKIFRFVLAEFLPHQGR